MLSQQKRRACLMLLQKGRRWAKVADDLVFLLYYVLRAAAVLWRTTAKTGSCVKYTAKSVIYHNHTTCRGRECGEVAG